MCLDKLKDFAVVLDKKGVGKGWKVFNERDNKLYSQFWHERSLPQNTWIHEEDFRPNCVAHHHTIKYGGGDYPQGFHLYRSAKDYPPYLINNNEVKKLIYFRNVVVTGYQLYDTIVAKEIYIPDSQPIIKNWYKRIISWFKSWLK